MTITYGIDASNHQGNQTSLGGVAAKFYIHKLTEGTGYTDPYAEANLAWARKQGITLTGGYHFLRKGSGSAQADYFVTRARLLFGQNLRGYLWQLDCESDATLSDIEAFKDRWDQQTGGVPIFFYTGDWWLQPKGWNVAAHGFVGLWSAPNRGYVGRAQNVVGSDWVANYGGFARITIVQYDARDAIGDTNQYNGTLAQLKTLVTGKPSTGGTGAGGETDTMKLVETSLSAVKDQPFGFNGEHHVINWEQENADPAHQHADTTAAHPQGYPGFVPAFSAYVDGSVYVHITGQQAGDMLQVRLAKHDWKDGKIVGTVYEVLYDQPCSDGDQYVTQYFRAYATAGQHWYIDVSVYNPNPDDGSTRELALVEAVWRPRQFKIG